MSTTTVTMDTRLPLAIMLPAYNEELDLPPLLQRIEHALQGWRSYCVLVVDDGSTDRTAAIVREAGRRMPITLIQHHRNQGLGGAIRTGLKVASRMADVVVTLDADNSQDPFLILPMVQALERGHEVVIASRFQPGAAEIGVPTHRRWLSHVAAWGLKLLAPYAGARDYTCGFRAYRASALEGLLQRYGENFLRDNGFACMLELLLNLRRQGARVGEVPLVLRYDLKGGASKMRIASTMRRYFVTVFRAWRPLPFAPLLPLAARIEPGEFVNARA